MLTKCPECELQVSDKALSCPHCGYPFVKYRPSASRSSSKRKRLPNGFGQITELKNQNLRNRFRAAVTVGKQSNGRPVVRLLKPKAYFSTYNDAYSALMEYNKNPYDLDSAMTVQQVFDKWSEDRWTNLSYVSKQQYKNAWLYCSSIYNMHIRDLRARHIKGCIDNGFIESEREKKYTSAATKSKIKQLFNQLLDYAVEFELTDKNYARTFTVSEDVYKELEDSRTPHLAFTKEELQKLWENEYNMPYAYLVLFQTYSGLRPQELGLIRINNVRLDKNYIVCGIKTKNGKDRIVPIHNKIRHIVEREYNRAKEAGFDFLFNYYERKGHTSPRMNYGRYRDNFLSIVKNLGLNEAHKPHDPRKTFITLAKKYNMDEYALKRIVGHAINDITEEIYTERPIEWLVSEMQKIGE